MPTELDCQGLACPEPVLRTRALLDTTTPPSHCRILVDNAIAATNVQRFLEQRGYSVNVSQQHATLWYVTTQQDSSGTAASDAVEAIGTASAEACFSGAACGSDVAAVLPQEKILVFITTETLGRGDDTLGGKLMATFLSTLKEMGSALWRIVLLNGGVKLAATEGAALTALQELAAGGVSILVCGTCLAHYGITEQKAVGETSNMLDIVTSLQIAHKVIRP